jgi:hypothetical protein
VGARAASAPEFHLVVAAETLSRKGSSVMSNKVTAANAKVIGAVGVICAIVWGVAGVLAVVENVWEITPVFFFWSYITLAMRAAYITAQRKPDCPLR